MLIKLLASAGRFRILCIALLQVSLESGYLLVDVRNVLFDYECKFLTTRDERKLGGKKGRLLLKRTGVDNEALSTYTNFHRPIIE